MTVSDNFIFHYGGGIQHVLSFIMRRSMILTNIFNSGINSVEIPSKAYSTQNECGRRKRNRTEKLGIHLYFPNHNKFINIKTFFCTIYCVLEKNT